VQTDKTTESAVEFTKELKDLAGAKPISETELTGARLTKVRGYAQQFESLGRVADQVLALWSVRLPTVELQQEPEKLMSVPVSAVNAAAAKYARPSGATLLLVGDLSKIEPGIRKLNLGEIVRLDVEGRPVQGK
jgi:zinc protease